MPGCLLKTTLRKSLLVVFTMLFMSSICSARITAQDMKRFNWVLENNPHSKNNIADKLPSSATTYGRDLHWVLDPKNRQKVQELKAQGKKFICYFTAGTMPAKNFITDANGKPAPTRYDEHFKKDGQGYSPACSKVTEWGDYWMSWKGPQNRAKAIKAITGVMDSASKENLCDGFEYDNTDHYNQGWSKTAGKEPSKGEEKDACGTQEDVVAVMKAVCQHAKKLGTSPFLKNSGTVAGQLAQDCDGVISEQCATFNECENFKAFADLGKPIFDIEYAKMDVQKDAKPYNLNNFASDCARLKSMGVTEFIAAPTQNVTGETSKGFCSDQSASSAPKSRAGAR